MKSYQVSREMLAKTVAHFDESCNFGVLTKLKRGL